MLVACKVQVWLIRNTHQQVRRRRKRGPPEQTSSCDTGKKNSYLFPNSQGPHDPENRCAADIQFSQNLKCTDKPLMIYMYSLNCHLILSQHPDTQKQSSYQSENLSVYSRFVTFFSQRKLPRQNRRLITK